MCGIAGAYHYRSLRPVDRADLERMAQIMAHRGPDGTGVYLDGPLGFGHRRLSIIDLSDRGRQPMATPDGRFVIAYNGEIYNYLELRAELEADGHRFRTDTDTEVVLALYARDGDGCLTRLNGMFALAIWDTSARRLILARDRVGIKPLYYVETTNGILFASEVKALVASPGVRCEVAHPLLATYMTYGYVPGEATLFDGVRKVLPGHYLVVDGNGVSAVQYWDVEFAPDHRRSADRTADELRALLLDAVRIHLRSDVPVGVFLSGGLDSSTTVALLQEAGVERIRTFSVAYEAGSGYDETPYSRLVADRFHTDHHVLYLDSTRFVDFIPRFTWHMDEPVTEAAGISLYYIAQLLRQHVTVALSGEGADELFAGYGIYRYMTWMEAYRRLPRWLRAGLVEPLVCRTGHPKLQKYARLAAKPLEERYLGVSLPAAVDVGDLYTPEFLEAAGGSLPCVSALAGFYERTRGADVLTRMLYTDLKAWLVDDLLIKADKMTMANSVELRVPFLDYRVVEYAASIPSSMKLRRGEGKWILKRAMRNRLPRRILEREKRGFPTPLRIMFRRDLTDYLRGVLLSAACLGRGYFRRDRLAQLIDEHARGQVDHHQLLWQLVVLEEWHKRFPDWRRTAGADVPGLAEAARQGASQAN